MTVTEFIELTFEFTEEDGQFAAVCLELDTASCGDTIEEAMKNLRETVTLHLSTLDDLGMLQKFLEERGIDPHFDYEPKFVQIDVGQIISRQRIALPEATTDVVVTER